MPGARRVQSAGAYREWRRSSVTIAGTRYALESKPGVFADGAIDPAALLLAERVTIAPGNVVVHLNCGNGLFGSVAARVADRVLLTDRNILAVQATRRTLDANSVTNVDVLLGHGATALPADVRADVVAIRIPQEKIALLQLVSDAFRILRIGGHCYLAGATNEGAKTATSTLVAVFGNGGVLAVDSGHRIAMATKRGETPASPQVLASPYLQSDAFNEIEAVIRGSARTLFTRPGVFSWDHLDEATSMLADAMEINLGESVLDLGCGCGVLGTVAATLSAERVCMVDADVEAVRSAARTAKAAGTDHCSVLTSDVAGEVLDQRFDVVVTNPPFHIGKTTDLDVPAQFIRDAHHVLSANGRLYLVANRTLPYERIIVQLFGNIRTLHDGRRFKVLSATKQQSD